METLFPENVMGEKKKIIIMFKVRQALLIPVTYNFSK